VNRNAAQQLYHCPPTIVSESLRNSQASSEKVATRFSVEATAKGDECMGKRARSRHSGSSKWRLRMNNWYSKNSAPYWERTSMWTPLLTNSSCNL